MSGRQPVTKPRVALDLDGVLADLADGLTRLAAHVFGTPIISAGAQASWGFEGVLVDAQLTAVWDMIRASRTFWSRLSPLVTPGEVGMLHGFDVVYVTSRIGLDVVGQTATWLSGLGLPAGPVFVTRDKDPVLREQGLPPILEDRPRNLKRLWVAGLPVYARDWPYNRGVEGVPRVSSVAEFLHLVRDASP